MELDFAKLERFELRAAAAKVIVDNLKETADFRAREVHGARHVARATVSSARLPRELLGLGPRDAAGFVAEYEANPARIEAALDSVPDDPVTRALRELRAAKICHQSTLEQLAAAESKYYEINGLATRLRDFARNI